MNIEFNPEINQTYKYSSTDRDEILYKIGSYTDKTYTEKLVNFSFIVNEKKGTKYHISTELEKFEITSSDQEIQEGDADTGFYRNLSFLCGQKLSIVTNKKAELSSIDNFPSFKKRIEDFSKMEKVYPKIGKDNINDVGLFTEKYFSVFFQQNLLPSFLKELNSDNKFVLREIIRVGDFKEIEILYKPSDDKDNTISFEMSSAIENIPIKIKEETFTFNGELNGSITLNKQSGIIIEKAMNIRVSSPIVTHSGRSSTIEYINRHRVRLLDGQ